MKIIIYNKNVLDDVYDLFINFIQRFKFNWYTLLFYLYFKLWIYNFYNCYREYIYILQSKYKVY